LEIRKKMAGNEILVSIVIICKNEEKLIAKSIESVLECTTGIKETEIILVDSISTDRTITIARNYPIKIYQLRKEWRHTPAAGKYIGFLKSSGRYIFFLDGDSFLIKEFLEKAIQLFEQNAEIAGILGRRREIYYKGEKIVGEIEDINNIGQSSGFIPKIAGSAMFRRSTLEDAGAYNPYLFSEEEAEISDRLRRNGFKILGVPIDMVIHNTLQRERVLTLFQRMKNNFHLGAGQILRYRINEKVSLEVLRKVASEIKLLLWALFGLITGIRAFLGGEYSFLLLWICLSMLLFLIFIAKSRSITKPVRYLIIWSIQSYAFFRGFLLKPEKAEKYPQDAIVIKE
jgi:glycosyltransferase involved in cell wall biosynthesis